MGGKIGVLVEINCESDFVARTEDFQNLAREIAMHIAAANPQYVRREEVPADVLEREREHLPRPDGRTRTSRPQVIEKIVEGKLDSFYEQVVPARPAVDPRSQGDDRPARAGGDRQDSARTSPSRASCASSSAKRRLGASSAQSRQRSQAQWRSRVDSHRAPDPSLLDYDRSDIIVRICPPPPTAASSSSSPAKP